MTALQNFLTEISPIEFTQNAAEVAAKSRDYFWYSPILTELLDGKVGDVVVTPRTQEEVVRVAAACARHRIHITLRGGGTGNYGQCVPMEGGVILDITQLNSVLNIAEGAVTCQAGILIADLERAVRASDVVPGGQEILMYPSTRDIATIGGFIAGGYAGAGSVRNGILKDAGNVTMIRVVTLETIPQVIELLGSDIQKVHHAYGTNGIITALTLRLQPAVEWVHQISLFDSYSTALRFGCEATEAIGASVDAFLITAVERRMAPYYQSTFGERFPVNKDAVFSMVHPAHLTAWRALLAKHGGTESMALTESQFENRKTPPGLRVCLQPHHAGGVKS